jgi:3-dehydro-L-gulonate 2-dehydrogenase
MRGGNYGWQAADAGCDRHLLVEHAPERPGVGHDDPADRQQPAHHRRAARERTRGARHGDVAVLVRRARHAPHSRAGASRGGGYDERGELTRDPAAIERTQRLLPIGFWKGSGLAILLDMVAAVLGGGKATHDFSTVPEEESGQSQVFIALDAGSLGAAGESDRSPTASSRRCTRARPDAGEEARYPGERTLEVRAKSMKEGVFVDDAMWKEVLAL